MKLDVLLIKPDFRDIALMPPLGLGYLHSSLAAAGFSAQVHDNCLYEYDDKAIEALLKETNPTVVGLYAATPMIRRALEIAAIAKRIYPERLVVLGGPHPSCTASETLASPAVDMVVIGEGEESFPEIVRRARSGRRDFADILGCAFKDGSGRVQETGPRPFIRDLDSVPFPALETMPVEKYFEKGATFGILQKKTRSIPIMASRGCPSTCTFCQRFLGRTFRIRSAENIVEELELRIKQFGVSEFNFLDDNFTLHKKRVLEVCDLIHKKDLRITFRFPNGVREDFLDEEILAALKSVGCYHLDFGIESGSQKVLDLMKKGKKVEQIAEKVRLCKRSGFKLSASFLFGTPGETLEDMEETIRFACSLPLDSASFGLIIPFPGTDVRKEAIEKGYLVHSDYDHYSPNIDYFKPPLATPEWTGADLLAMQKKGNRRFFFRPKQMMKLLPTLANPMNIKRYALSFYHVVKKG